MSNILTFMAEGLRLEEAQRRLRVMAGVMLTGYELEETRRSLRNEMQNWRHLQRMYSPPATARVTTEQASRDPGTAPVEIEHVKLYLPSALSEQERAGCKTGVVAIEGLMREAQCWVALEELRTRAQEHALLVESRKKTVGGHEDAMRWNNLIRDISERAMVSTDKFVRARDALLALDDSA
ncbi:hypothetical protein C8J57DRAFT_1507615 [Mycena rebaudengoi]|nr:hypothetical protein C8J57DRAFT_1507615 [Mycena rebaudengoi]